MQAFDIALKDIRHSFTSLFGFMFMFAVPLLMVGLIAVAFGGTATSKPHVHRPGHAGRAAQR